MNWTMSNSSLPHHKQSCTQETWQSCLHNMNINLGCWYRILFGLDSRVKTKTKTKKNWKRCKIMNFKSKRDKNKYNMFEWWIKSHNNLKIQFTAIKTKTLTGYGQNVDFFIWPLDHVEFWIVLYGIVFPLKW